MRRRIGSSPASTYSSSSTPARSSIGIVGASASGVSATASAGPSGGNESEASPALARATSSSVTVPVARRRLATTLPVKGGLTASASSLFRYHHASSRI